MPEQTVLPVIGNNVIVNAIYTLPHPSGEDGQTTDGQRFEGRRN